MEHDLGDVRKEGMKEDKERERERENEGDIVN